MKNRKTEVGPGICASATLFAIEKELAAYMKGSEFRTFVGPHFGDNLFVPMWQKGHEIVGGFTTDGFVEREKNPIPDRKDIVRKVSFKEGIANCKNPSLSTIGEHGDVVEVIKNWIYMALSPHSRTKLIEHRTKVVNHGAKQAKLPLSKRAIQPAQGRASMEITA
jgi:hypothetical protein